jgi:protein-disulfide isomerase
MKFHPLLLLSGVALALSGCGDKKAADAAPTGQAIAAVPAPAGTKWSDKVEATPEGGFRMGNPDAPLKLIEFGSYTCPHCRDFAAESAEPLKRDYVDTGKLSFEYRNYIRDPLDLTVALVVRCGGKDVFFAMSEQAFANQEAMFARIQSLSQGALENALNAPPGERFVRAADLAGLITFAQQRGIAADQAKSCLSDGKAAQALADNVQKANGQYNITGTPTLILNGSVLENTATWPALVQKLKEAGA